MHTKQFFVGTLALSALLGAFASAAPQDNTAAAAREEMELNYKRMQVKIEQLEEAFRAQQKTFADLAGEISGLRSEVDRLKNKNENAATQESIRTLKDKIEEVDRKRLADNERVTKTLSGIAKDLSKTPVAPPPKESLPPKEKDKDKEPGGSSRADKGSKDPPSGAPEKSYEYKIKSGDTLARIVTELRAQNWKVTQKQVSDANPGVNWSKLKIGQTILIPSPASP
jgi:LysM repeat protein